MEGKVSIIVPIYNTDKYLALCIESLINQTYSNLEIILIDDGSNDNSANICKEYAKKDKRIIYLRRKENSKKAAKPRNNGLKIASGEYIIFVDSDDYIMENMVERMLYHLDDSDMVACILTDDSRDKITLDKDYLKLSYKEIIDDIFNNQDYLTPTIAQKIYKADIAKDIMLDDIYYGEDTIYLIKYILKAKPTLKVINEKLYHITTRNSSLTSTKFNEKYLDDIIAYETIYDLLKDEYQEINSKVINRIIYKIAYYNILNSELKSKKINKILKSKYKKYLKYQEYQDISLRNKMIYQISMLFPKILFYILKWKKVIK